ncbi:MAG: prepilin-type N-terminal cleavage/methylation domain-containing protein [Alphaproteobacteria bacterium]|nr:prepilin-type N-terminal cleavage/methylation domain-containing protein [Alphaproteobacteria bacterium]
MKQNARTGFTLLELSIALTIIALISAIGLRASVGVVESARQAATQKKLDEIQAALLNFRKTHHRLPCPAPNSLANDHASFGIEAEPGICESNGAANNRIFTINDGFESVAEGAVPVRLLGLSNEMAHDGWGRRFSYSVMTALTSKQAMNGIYPAESCGMDITASDVLTNLRSDNRAAYSLISAGANGHGAYQSDGTVFYAGSTNTAELLNCRCTATAQGSTLTATVLQEYSQSLTTSTDQYDDIVRYENLWRLITPSDDVNANAYREINMLIAFSGSNIAAYSKRCDRFESVATTGSLLPSTLSFMRFINNNRHLLTYDPAAGCQLFSIIGTTVTTLTAPSCPTGSASQGIALSDNGYLAISPNASPFLRIWRQSNTSFVESVIAFEPSSAIPPAQPDLIAITEDASYIAMLRTSATAYARLYRRSDNNRLTPIDPAPTLFDTSLTAIAFSKDGRYMAGARGDRLILWSNAIDNGFIYSRIEVTTPLSSISAIDFSPDGRYIAVGSNNTGQYDSSSPPVVIYRFSDSPIAGLQLTELSEAPFEILNQIGSYTTTQRIHSLRFTRDSMYLVALEASTANNETNKVVVYKRQDNLKFTYARGVNGVAGAAAPTAMALIR